ncbi:RelA/SpoT family protein [Candidatus Peregrinibacteria bacterium]|nr:RelA/SpoT family protein [Candidatus Peregrinibacteria bacterium]
MKVKENELVKKLIKDHGVQLDDLIMKIKSYLPDFNEDKFREAFAFAAVAHDGQMRKQAGVPYIVHPFETVKILTNIHADETTLIAALMHDVPEDTEYTLDEIEKRFGKKVAYLVEGITKLSKVHYRHDMQKREVESLKKLFIHVAQDPRTMLIKLADRLHNMRTLEYMDVPEKRIRKARETLEIFAPIASLLGIKEIQAELEDLCFKNLFPDLYYELRDKVAEDRGNNKKHQEEILQTVEKELGDIGIDAIVYSQERNLYEIYKFLSRERKSVQDYESRFQISILVTTVPECYQVLGLIHNLYKPIANSFQDYISLPQANGYQSLHTSVFGNKGIVTKFIIRTNHMHYEAQYGVAARYFIKGSVDSNLFENNDPRSQWVEEVIEIQKEEIDRDQFMDDLKSDVFQDRINVFTPKGQAVNLPVGSTCIDFAYNIHTEVGHRAIRAIVNQNNVPLSHVLGKGDVIKIVTSEYPKSPSYEWLNFAKTSFAKKKMKEYFRKESRTSKIIVGRKMLQKEYDRAGLGLVNNISKWRISKFSEKYSLLKIESLEDILVQIAEGSIAPLDFINIIYKNDADKSHKKHDLNNASANEKLIKFSIKVTCETFVNIAKIVEIWQDRRSEVFMQIGEIKSNYFDQKMTIRSTMFAKDYETLSRICSEIEQVDGVKEVTRVFRWRKVGFIAVSLVTFGIWALHPFLLYYLANNQILSTGQQLILINVLVYSGMLILFGLILSEKHYTETSFPGLRESNRLWLITYLLSFFALATVLFEIYAYQLEVNWLAYAILTIVLFTYLTSQYIHFRKTRKNTKFYYQQNYPKSGESA